MTALRIALVTEAGPEVGWGHLARCRALARAARALDARPFFLVEGEPGLMARLCAEGLEAVAMPWRAEPERALEAIRARGAGLAVVDSYAAGPGLLASLRRAVDRVVLVDDLGAPPGPADVVVNGGIGAEGLPYRRADGTRYLLGPRYAMLDPDFASAPDRRPAGELRRVLVTLGGGRVADAARSAVEAVDRALPGCAVDVAAGTLGDGLPALEAAARTARNAVTVHRGRVGLRALMLSADVAIAGAGVTLAELAATATPAVVLRMADNQRPNAEASAREGFALPGGAAGDPDLGGVIEAALRRLAGDAALRARMSGRGRALVDGRGAARVAEALVEAAVAGG